MCGDSGMAAHAVVTELVIPARIEIPVTPPQLIPVPQGMESAGVVVLLVGDTSKASMGCVEGPASPSGRVCRPGHFF